MLLPDTAQAEALALAFVRRIDNLEHLDGGPFLARCAMGDVRNQLRGHRGNCCQKDAEDRTGGHHVIVRPMGGNRRTEGLHQVDEPMGFQLRQRDARQIERIEPQIALQGIPRRMLGAEVLIEGGIMRHKIAFAHEFDQARQSLCGTRGVLDVLVVDIGQMLDFFGNGLSGVHEGGVPAHDLTLAKASCGDLGQLIILERDTCGLGIDHHHILIQFPEIPFPGRLHEAAITGADPLGSGFAYVLFHIG